MAPRPPPGLMDDLIGEILLRLPPEDPECLVRASVVCKPWRHLLSDPGFPRCYREFHGSPPMLGFLYNDDYHRKDRRCCRFIPIKEASPILNHQPEPGCWTFDCRHGRVLLFNSKTGLIVWDPITNMRLHIGQPEIKQYPYYYAAAVLCALDGCDHLDCHGSPSLVVFVDMCMTIADESVITSSMSASASVYSIDTGAWNSGVPSVHLGPTMYASKTIGSSLLTRDALYFIFGKGQRILKYDLAGRGLTVMSSPSLPMGNMVLMKAEGGGLGACGLEGDSLHLWTWRTRPGGISEWQRGRVIQLDIGDLYTKLDVVDFAEGAGSIFVRTHNGIFAVELKSGQARKIGKGGNFKDIFPFMSFYIPIVLV